MSRSALARNLPMLLSAAILLGFVLLEPTFQRPFYWRVLTEQYFAAAVLALALTPIVLTGGIDLSIGSVTVFSGVVAGWLWRDAGWPIEAALAGGVAAGGIAGMVNGSLVAARVPPLVATLATRELFRGLAEGIAGRNPVDRFPPELRTVWRTSGFGVPLPVLVLPIVALVAWLVVHRTWVGRMLFAIGDNETAARFAVVPVRRIEVGLYAACGLAAGIAGIGQAMRYGSAKPDADASLELTAIACVVLGGVRITGGSGYVAGTLLGVATVAALLSGLGGASAAWRDIITGGLVVAVAVAGEAARRWSNR